MLGVCSVKEIKPNDRIRAETCVAPVPGSSTRVNGCVTPILVMVPNSFSKGERSSIDVQIDDCFGVRDGVGPEKVR